MVSPYGVAQIGGEGKVFMLKKYQLYNILNLYGTNNTFFLIQSFKFIIKTNFII